MKSIRACLLSASLASVLSMGAATVLFSGPAQASEIKYVVNSTAITSFDIQKRVAFLKLQRRTGDLSKQAADDLVEEALKKGEMARLKINTPDSAVDAAFTKFAAGNKLTAQQMSSILEKGGVSTAHFKDYMKTQMGWNQAVAARYRAQGGSMTEQEVVQRMLQNGGTKPTATEYMLQQVIFVVPATEKGAMGKRKKEADAMRARFSSCDSTRQFAKGLIDVTVRDLGRLLAPELPREWAEDIKKTKVGGTTGSRETPRGVEFIGICSSREVSDDRVAKMVFQSEGTEDEQGEALSKKYVAELRKRARIVQR